MRRLFPPPRKIVVKGAGHWVHAQRPEVVVEVLRQLAA
jgi:pimeloyl-ACP methyl ester carboxylesterase